MTRKKRRTAKGHCDVSTGSLPVSSAEALCRDWKKRIKIARDLRGLQHKQGNKASSRRWRMRADAIEQCVEDLRREMARATVRQPEENNGSQTQPTTTNQL